MDCGELVPDEIVMKMVEERLARPDCAAGLSSTVFRGRCRRPRSSTQISESLGFGKPIVMDIRSIRRSCCGGLSGRWTCSVGGEIYNIL